MVLDDGTTRSGGGPTTPHPLLGVLEAAADGRHPQVDGEVTFLPELAGGNRAIVALTGHAYLCTDQEPSTLGDLGLDGFGAALDPRAVLRVADGGTVGVNDVILVIQGTGGGVDLAPTAAWDDHHRVAHARSLRTEVAVYGDGRGFVTIARGLAGRWELSIEVADPGAEPGQGRRLLDRARGAVEPGGWLFAAVSPGNARSLRSFLAAGFTPIGSEVIIQRSAAGLADETGRTGSAGQERRWLGGRR